MLIFHVYDLLMLSSLKLILLMKFAVAVGEVERAFRKSFSTGKREKLVKTMQCYLSTTSGPISGMLFISTDKIAFHSERSITVTSPTGNLIKVPYKVIN